jgi:hypothetical protein
VAGKNSSFFEVHFNPLTFTHNYSQTERSSEGKADKEMMQVMSTLFAVKLMYFFTVIANFYSFSLLTYPYFTIFNAHFSNHSTQTMARGSTASPAFLSELPAGPTNALYSHNR